MSKHGIGPNGHIAAVRFKTIKNSNDLVGNRTRNLPTHCAVTCPVLYLMANYYKINYRYDKYCLECDYICIKHIFLCFYNQPFIQASYLVSTIGSFSVGGGLSARDMKLITYLHLMPKLRISGAVPPPFVCLHSVNRD